MKHFFVLCFIITLISCEKEGDLNTMNETTIDSNSVLSHTGTFMPTSGINANGNVNIFMQNGATVLELKDVSISGGPDLKVYLSKSNAPDDFVNLGNYTNGTTTYKIPNSVVISQYSYVLVHCQQYNHLFAIAQLKSK